MPFTHVETILPCVNRHEKMIVLECSLMITFEIDERLRRAKGTKMLINTKVIINLGWSVFGMGWTSWRIMYWGAVAVMTSVIQSSYTYGVVGRC